MQSLLYICTCRERDLLFFVGDGEVAGYNRKFYLVDNSILVQLFIETCPPMFHRIKDLIIHGFFFIIFFGERKILFKGKPMLLQFSDSLKRDKKPAVFHRVLMCEGFWVTTPPLNCFFVRFTIYINNADEMV